MAADGAAFVWAGEGRDGGDGRGNARTEGADPRAGTRAGGRPHAAFSEPTGHDLRAGQSLPQGEDGDGRAVVGLAVQCGRHVRRVPLAAFPGFTPWHTHARRRIPAARDAHCAHAQGSRPRVVLPRRRRHRPAAVVADGSPIPIPIAITITISIAFPIPIPIDDVELHHVVSAHRAIVDGATVVVVCVHHRARARAVRHRVRALCREGKD